MPDATEIQKLLEEKMTLQERVKKSNEESLRNLDKFNVSSGAYKRFIKVKKKTHGPRHFVKVYYTNPKMHKHMRSQSKLIWLNVSVSC